MQFKEFANGKIRIGSLLGQQEDGSFRSSDARGEVSLLRLSGGEKMVETAGFSQAGVQRAFHLHAGFHEMQYVVQGSLRLLAAENESSEIIDETVRQGDVIRIDAGVAHGLIALEPSLVLVTGSGTDSFVDRTKAEWLKKAL